MPSPDKEFMQAFVVSGGRKMVDLLRWRFLGHLASALVAAPTTSLRSAQRTVMFNPLSLKGHYFPGMDEDIRHRVMKALLERGEHLARPDGLVVSERATALHGITQKMD